MVKLYKVVHWEFDSQAWGRAIKAWVKTVGEHAIAEACGVSASTVMNWANGSMPQMGNFIKVCDELSLDPREFFTTSE